MRIAAIVLAAGQSKRMGQSKMLLRWGEMTVLGQVLATLRQANILDIVVVVGPDRIRVEKISAAFDTRIAYNPDYANDEMLASLQCGLRVLSAPPVEGFVKARAALVCLGDQPQIQVGSVRAVADRFEQTRARIVVPSYRMRRGHPWLVRRSLWRSILSMRAPASPRDFLNRYAAEIEYVNVDTPTILADLDTPEEYANSKP